MAIDMIEHVRGKVRKATGTVMIVCGFISLLLASFFAPTLGFVLLAITWITGGLLVKHV